MCQRWDIFSGEGTIDSTTKLVKIFSTQNYPTGGQENNPKLIKHSEEAKLLHAKCFILHDSLVMWLSQRFAKGILQAYVFYQFDAEEM